MVRIPGVFPSSLLSCNPLFKETTCGSVRSMLLSPEGRALSPSSKFRLMKVSHHLCASTVENGLLPQTTVLQAQHKHGCFEISAPVVIRMRGGSLKPTAGQGRRTHQDLPLPEARLGVGDCGGKGGCFRLDL